MKYHYLVLLAHMTPAQRQLVVNALKSTLSQDWFNYFPDAWIICSWITPQQMHHEMQKLVTEPQAYHQVMQLLSGMQVTGALPEAAWTWLRRHGLMPDSQFRQH